MPPPALVVVLGGNPVTSISVFACLDAADTRALRRLHPAVKATVAGVPWVDTETPVTDLVRWRTALPGAAGAKVSRKLSTFMLLQCEFALAGLTQLCLFHCVPQGTSSWDDVLRRLPPSLRILKVGGADSISEDSVAHLTALASLECHCLTILSAVERGLPPTLRELQLDACHFNLQRSFQRLRELRSLVCVRGELSDVEVSNLPPALQRLGLVAMYWVPESMSLAHLTHLTECDVHGTNIDDATLASLPATMVMLYAASCKKLSCGASFAHLPALRQLNARESGIGDASLASLPPSLTLLDARRCSALTPTAVFPTLPALRVLEVSNTDIGDAAVASMPAGLTDLRMADCGHVTRDASLEHLPALRVLHSWGTALLPAVVMACRERGCAASIAVGALHSGVDALALSPLADGRLAFVDGSSRLHLWPYSETIKTGIVKEAGGGPWRVCALAAMPDGRRVAEARGCCIEVWDVTTVPPTRDATVSCGSPVAVLAALRDGRLAAACQYCAVEVVNVSGDAGVVVVVLNGHGNYVEALAELHDNNLASGSRDGTVRVWDMTTYACIATLNGHAGEVPSLAVLADGRLACGSGRREVRLWDPRTRTSAGVLARQGHQVVALAALPDGRLACASAYSGDIWLWDTRPAAAAAAARPADAAPKYEIGCHDAYRLTRTLKLVALSDGHLVSLEGGVFRKWLPPPLPPT